MLGYSIIKTKELRRLRLRIASLEHSQQVWTRGLAKALAGKAEAEQRAMDVWGGYGQVPYPPRGRAT